jgi:hypothetical protein
MNEYPSQETLADWADCSERRALSADILRVHQRAQQLYEALGEAVIRDRTGVEVRVRLEPLLTALQQAAEYAKARVLVGAEWWARSDIPGRERIRAQYLHSAATLEVPTLDLSIFPAGDWVDTTDMGDWQHFNEAVALFSARLSIPGPARSWSGGGIDAPGRGWSYTV